MNVALRKYFSLLLALLVALAPVRFVYAVGQDILDSAETVIEHMAMPDCMDEMDTTAGEGCFLMGDSAQGQDGCTVSDCSACPGVQLLTQEVFTVVTPLSSIYSISLLPRCTDTLVIADYRPPKVLS